MDLKKLKQLAVNFSVLYVEDDEGIAINFTHYLKKLFTHVDYCVNGQEGLACYEKYRHDIVITDITMPMMDGLTMARNIKAINSEQNILITSAYSEPEKFIESIKIGVEGYILKPIDYNKLNETLYKIVRQIKTFREHALYEDNLEKLVEEKIEENRALSVEKIDNYEKTLLALVEMIDSRDRYTGRHSIRVAEYTKLIAHELNYSQRECDELYRAGILHDLGKIAIPDSLLLKPGKFTGSEYSLIKEHVRIGTHLLEQIPMFKEISTVIECHHERLDGSGYPNGLKGDEISTKGNIMAVADSFDAMTTNRIYKGRKSVKEALEELVSLSDIHFKKEVVDAAIKVLSNITIDTSITQRPTTKLEQERFSYFYKDILTQTFNENYLDFVLAQNKQDKAFSSIFVIFMDNFGKYNQLHSWSEGNKLLQKIAEKLIELFPEDRLFRIHGDDFVLIRQVETLDREHLKKLQPLLEENDKRLRYSVKEVDVTKNEIYSFYLLEEFI